MGRTIETVEREILAKSVDVAGITPQHIFLKTGDVIDPQEYDKTRVVGFMFTYQVLKLVRCYPYCNKHITEKGRHIVVELPHAISPFGNFHHECWMLPKGFCDIDNWDIEEAFTKADAERYEVFTKTKIVKATLVKTGLIYLK